MKIHTADDTTQYNHIIQMTLLLPQKLHTFVTDSNNDRYVETVESEDYLNKCYPNLRQHIGLNKRPADLCGLCELSESWDKNLSDFTKYVVTMRITGFGIEYTPTEMIKFFTNVFPEFTDDIPKPLSDVTTHGYREHTIAMTKEI